MRRSITAGCIMLTCFALASSEARAQHDADTPRVKRFDGPMAAWVKRTTVRRSQAGNEERIIETELLMRNERGQTRREANGLVQLQGPGLRPTLVDAKSGRPVSAPSEPYRVPEYALEATGLTEEQYLAAMEELLRKTPPPEVKPPPPISSKTIEEKDLGEKTIRGINARGRLVVTEISPVAGVTSKPSRNYVETWVVATSGAPLQIESINELDGSTMTLEFFHLDPSAMDPRLFEPPLE